MISATVFACLLSVALSQTVTFTVDPTSVVRPFPHFWERCVGSGHAALALRADWRDHLTKAQRDHGWQYVRMHGIFNDDVSVVIDDGVYSFFNVDSIYDFLLSINMRPIIELSFMPTVYASGNSTIFYYKGNITPPKDYKKWEDLLVHFAQHLVDRYGIEEVSQWYFENWNEPNCGFWTGTKEEYFNLLSHTYHAIKSVDSSLRVGGPATCQSEWINDTIAFCQQQGIKLDFISTHLYPTDPLGVDPRNIMKTIFTRTKTQANGLPVLYTEYNSGLFGNYSNHDLPYAAAFAIKFVNDVQGIVEMASYWTFSDIFEEGGLVAAPFHDMYGMMSNIGVPKPAWQAFKWLHQAGDTQVTVTKSATNPVSLGAWAVKDDEKLTIFAYNFDYLTEGITNQQFQIVVKGVAAKGNPHVQGQLIDDSNGNPRGSWMSMGSPEYPSSSQMLQLQQAGTLSSFDISYSVLAGGDISFTTPVMVPYSSLRITIPLSFAQQ